MDCSMVDIVRHLTFIESSSPQGYPTRIELPLLVMPGRQLAFDPIAEARRQWDLHWGSEATPEMVAVTSIMRAQQILLARLNALLEPLDLTFPGYEALMVLCYR